MFDLDVDVGRVAQVITRDGVHVIDQSTDRRQTHDRPPTFLYRSYTQLKHKLHYTRFHVTCCWLLTTSRCNGIWETDTTDFYQR